MRNIGFGQLLVLLLLCFILFGDFIRLRKVLTELGKKAKTVFAQQNNRKKGN